MSYRAVIAAIAAVILFSSTNPVARSAPAEADMLDDVVVVANRAPEPLSKIGNSVTVLDSAAIEDSQAVVVSDLLAQTPGVTFARNGGVGATTSVYIRGAESNQ